MAGAGDATPCSQAGPGRAGGTSPSSVCGTWCSERSGLRLSGSAVRAGGTCGSSGRMAGGGSRCRPSCPCPSGALPVSPLVALDQVAEWQEEWGLVAVPVAGGVPLAFASGGVAVEDELAAAVGHCGPLVSALTPRPCAVGETRQASSPRPGPVAASPASPKTVSLTSAPAAQRGVPSPR